MKRFLLALLVVLSALPQACAAAQTPVATPDPFMLPINHLVLRLTEGNGFEYMTDAFDRLVNTGYYQVDDGVVHPAAPPWIGAAYLEHEVQDLYIALAFLVPEEPRTDVEATIGITVDTRLMTFRDASMAGHFVTGFQTLAEEQAAADPEAPRDIAAITNLPAHDEAIVGVTGTDPYYNLTTLDQADIQVPFTRFILQKGAMVASVKVTSLDPAFNDAVTRDLLTAQLACLQVNTPCVPIPMKDGVPYAPEIPVASPVAVAPASVTHPGVRSRA